MKRHDCIFWACMIVASWLAFFIVGNLVGMYL